MTSDRRPRSPGERTRLPGPIPRIVVVGPKMGLDVRPGASNNRAMDPVVIALAQLVRDRWAREQPAEDARRSHLRVVKKEPR